MGAQDTRLVKSKQTLGREEFAAMLESLASSVREGRVRFHQGQESVEVDLPRRLRVDLEVKDAPRTDATKREIEIEAHWMVDAEGSAIDSDPGGGVTIG
jgi:amphi-Trp domain-containing protein